ncbi:TlpA family protein disulfide reductase [Desulfovibrio oxyclinae]|uniref:TlpA family protein disulfide reductase n=1 Tax=Desulfovibrio oxyclinae TaxID=63560 RepID=UPI00037B4C8D|nr:TlpA disulfide reductase family protein [Desulfovibrio oxyclinae]
MPKDITTKLTRVTLSALLMLLAFSVTAHAAQKMPDLHLTAGPGQAEELGLGKGTEAFRLSDIPAEAVFIEVFSMYCPICQRDAPRVEELYDLVQKKAPGLLMFGIGAGNSQYETDVYSEKYNVRMPMLPDADYKAHKALGNVGTPFYILLEKNDDGSFKVLFTQEGEILKKQEFFETVISKAQKALK